MDSKQQHQIRKEKSKRKLFCFFNNIKFPSKIFSTLQISSSHFLGFSDLYFFKLRSFRKPPNSENGEIVILILISSSQRIKNTHSHLLKARIAIQKSFIHFLRQSITLSQKEFELKAIFRPRHNNPKCNC